MLDDNTINKIAAGEVVDRPSSVVKELVENAIDAGAHRIEVEIQSGGTSLIRVTDDGIGMNEDDARLSIQRHATSKISNVDDLFLIDTLGFRGEALPSIAAVARFSMHTRTHDSDLGTKVLIIGGKEKEIGSIGCAVGTTIQVEDLFFNTPARKKFLKTNATETNRVQEILSKLAFSHPEISFKFISGNRTIFQTPGNTDLLNVICSIYGETNRDLILPIDFSDEEVFITGYTSKPNYIKSSRAWQTILVNGRAVQNRAVAKALDNAYRSLIPRVGFPLSVIEIKLPTKFVDINVHPQKTELKFADESKIFHTVYHAINDSIRKDSDHANLKNFALQKNLPKSKSKLEPFQFFEPSEKNISEYVQDQKFSQDQTFTQEQNQKFVDTPFEKLPTEPTPKQRTTMDPNLRDDPLEPIGQISKCYIIAKDSTGMYIVDQHAAHERILFDRFSARTDGIPAQQLLINAILKFEPRESELIERNKDLFHQLGFSMESSGDNEFRLIEIPADVPSAEAETLLREIIADLNEQHQPTSDQIRKTCLATTACRAAIKAGMVLSIQQMKILLDELSKTSFPYTCPHGRPTIIRFSSDELATMFNRTGFEKSTEDRF